MAVFGICLREDSVRALGFIIQVEKDELPDMSAESKEWRITKYVSCRISVFGIRLMQLEAFESFKL